MAVFISYSSRDTVPVEQLVTTLRRAREEVWIDDALGGGDAWWRMILDQIRRCDVFLVALSQNMLTSKACQAEVQYAQALGKPMLPVQVGPVESMRTNPMAAMQVIDYQSPTIDTGVELIAALRVQRALSPPLPEPLPEEPAMPFAYLMRLGGLIAAPQLIPQQQTVVVAELKAGLEDDGDDPTARRDIAQLLRTLADRSDVTYRTRTEAESLLSSLEAAPVRTEVSNETAPQTFSGPAQAPPRSRKPLLIAGGIATALIAAVAAVLVVKSGGAPSAETATTATLAAGAGPTDPAALLLSDDQIGAIIGVPNIKGGTVYGFLDRSEVTTSHPDCLGAAYNVTKAAYEGTGYNKVAQQNFQSKDVSYYWVNQAAVSFPSADEARAFLRASAGKWTACAGETVAITGDGNTSNWLYHDVAERDAQITQSSTQEGLNVYGCQHVLRVVSNIVVEVMACNDATEDAAIRIAEEMAARAHPAG